jgi:hypothetical protein
MKSSRHTIKVLPENAVYSGSKLNIIPVNPQYQPAIEQAEGVVEILKTEFPQCEIVSEIFDESVFADSGELFENVSCNVCGETMAIEDWQELMSVSFENSRFENLEITTPCCNTKSNLNNLKYHWDCGFTTYLVSVINPEIDRQQVERIKQKLSKNLGFEIKIFQSRI